MSLLFHNPNKFNTAWRLLEPFVLLAEGLLALILLPIPFSSSLYNRYLRKVIKADMQVRINRLKK